MEQLLTKPQGSTKSEPMPSPLAWVGRSRPRDCSNLPGLLALNASHSAITIEQWWGSPGSLGTRSPNRLRRPRDVDLLLIGDVHLSKHGRLGQASDFY